MTGLSKYYKQGLLVHCQTVLLHCAKPTTRLIRPPRQQTPHPTSHRLADSATAEVHKVGIVLGHYASRSTASGGMSLQSVSIIFHYRSQRICLPIKVACSDFLVKIDYKNNARPERPDRGNPPERMISTKDRIYSDVPSIRALQRKSRHN